MVSIYIVLSVVTIFSSFTETLGSEEKNIQADILAEISLMRSDMNQMFSTKSEMDQMIANRIHMMDNRIHMMDNRIHMMDNRMEKLIRQVENLCDNHFPTNTTTPTLPLRTTTPTLPLRTTTPTPSTPRPQTSSATPPPLPAQPSVCTSYTPLTDSWRHIDYVNRGNFPKHCDKTGSAKYVTYTYTNLAVSWYRFTGAAGTKLPTAPAPVSGRPGYTGNQICGTWAVGYISSGGNPTIQDGIVTRYVCFELLSDEYSSSRCLDKTTVQVAACKDIHGDYFVYQLHAAPICTSAYCAID